MFLNMQYRNAVMYFMRDVYIDIQPYTLLVENLYYTNYQYSF